jgi:hypothetical protein
MAQKGTYFELYEKQLLEEEENAWKPLTIQQIV